MLTIFHGPSPNGEMFASDRFIGTGRWKDRRPALISVCEGPPFLAVGPMDKNAQLHWTIPMAILPSFQQLRFLCALAEQCHFGRASESCAGTLSSLRHETKPICRGRRNAPSSGVAARLAIAPSLNPLD